MQLKRKDFRPVILSTLFLAFLLLPSLAAAHPHSHPRIKDRIARLESRLALQTNLLQSQIDYQARRTANMVPGGGMCGDPCAIDSDNDGIGDCEDVCPCDDNAFDTDHDGNSDCADPCPNDATDACANPCSEDSDRDGMNDCEDPCPYDPANPVDSDGDGLHDCQDACPHNANHDCYAECEWDQDGDGLPDCSDPCPWVAESLRASMMHDGDDDRHDGMTDCPMPHN
jgi:hypothetical protein